MEQQNLNEMNGMHHGHSRHQRLGRIFGGLLLVAVGLILIAQKLGYYVPEWLLTWEALVIAIGLVIGAKQGFRGFGWLIPIVIGGVFLIDNIYPDTPLKPFIIPALVIAAGLYMIFKPRRKKQAGAVWSRYDRECMPGEQVSSEDYMDTTVVFGGVNKTIISKNFKGGDIVCVFGGGEINLSQADINGRVILDATLIFGGAKLIIPSNWQLQPEMTAILGGIEDKRVSSGTYDPDKILVLKGTTLFGGLEIKSY